MFATSVLDVGIGLVLVFLCVSLVASAATEALAALVSLRARTLRRGIGRLLNDPGYTGLARRIYAHALVDPFLDPARLVDGRTPRPGPSHVPAGQFAVAMIAVLRRDAGGAALAPAVDAIADETLRHGVRAILDQAEGDAERFRVLLADWFAASMAQLSAFYRRRAQAIAFGVALAVAVAADADALHVAAAIWAHTLLVSGTDLSAIAADPDGAALLRTLAADQLLGWAGRSFAPIAHPLAALQALAGWVIVAVSSLFGAPFWFDALRRLVRWAPPEGGGR